MNRKLLIVTIVMAPLLGGVQGCATAVVVGASAAGGYLAHAEGYRLRNPLTHDRDASETRVE